MKTTFFVTASLCLSNFAFSQTLSDAIKLTINEQFDKADQSFKTLVTTQPNGENYFYYGENYFKNDHLSLADSLYKRGIAVDPTNPLNYVGVGKILWNQGKQAEAKTNFDQALKLGANMNPTVFMKIAEAYIYPDNKNLAEATNLLNQALKLQPQDPEIFLLLGDVYLEENNGTKAVENYEKALILDKKSVRAVLRQGQVYKRAKNVNLALDYYRTANSIDSTFAPAYREKAEIYALARMYSQATEQYKKYLALNDDCSAKGRYAGFLMEAKEHATSIETSKEALICDPGNIYLYRYLAYSQFEIGDYTNGLANISTFFANAGPNVKIIPMDYEYRGRLYGKTGNDSLAIEDFKKVIELKPEKIGELTSTMATSYIKMKKHSDAIELYKSILDTASKPSVNDYFGLGRAYYFSKDYVNADSAFSKVAKLKPELPLGYLWQARSSANIDDKNEKWLAKPFYEAYISKIDPEETGKNKKDLIEAYTYMGVFYTNNKEICIAKTQFQKISEWDPENQNAKKFLASPEAAKCN